MSADRMQQIEPAIGLHVEDEIEFVLVLIGQEVAALQPGRVQQHVDAAALLPDLIDDFSYAGGVGEVDTEVVRRSASRADGIDRTKCSVSTLQCGQFFFDQRGSGAFATCLHAREQLALEVVFVADKPGEIRIIRVGLGHQIEQVKGAARSRSQVRRYGGNNASRGSRDHEDAVSVECEAGLAIVGRSVPVDRRSSAIRSCSRFRLRLCRAGFRQSGRRDLRGIAIRCKIDGFDQGLRTLALVGFGESHHRAAHGRKRTGWVIAMLAAKSSC